MSVNCHQNVMSINFTFGGSSKYDHTVHVYLCWVKTTPYQRLVVIYRARFFFLSLPFHAYKKYLWRQTHTQNKTQLKYLQWKVIAIIYKCSMFNVDIAFVPVLFTFVYLDARCCFIGKNVYSVRCIVAQWICEGALLKTYYIYIHI